MDSRATKPHSKRLPHDSEQLSSRLPNRLFLNETIPPSVHQQHQQTAQNRAPNLSNRIHEYYEKLLENSQLKKTDHASVGHQYPATNLQPRFDDPNAVDRSRVGVPRYGQPQQPSVSIRTALQPSNSNARQPYTVFVEDPTGAFQSFNKKKSSSANPSGSSYSEAVNAADSAGLSSRREKSKSPNSNQAQCALCHSSNHSSKNCSLNSQSFVSSDHHGFFSDPIPVGSSPPTRHSKANDENQGDGSENRKATSSFAKKRNIPANINVQCERDVIGQEKSPVSKSHPVGSAALSTSSSNGDTVPRERKKWVRPPLVGQAASSADKSPFTFDCLDDHSPSLEKGKTSSECLQLSSSTGSDQADTRDGAKGFTPPKSSYFDLSNNAAGGMPHATDDFYGVDRDVSLATSQQLTSEGEQGLSDSYAGGRVSPSSSVTSNRRLEWDSGADVGYNQMYGSTTPEASSSGLCTIERMALAKGCSVALHLRLDPEGTTVPASSSGLVAPILPSPVQDKPTPRLVGKPSAESTPLDQGFQASKALFRYANTPKNVISPILQGNKNDGVDLQIVSTSLHEEENDQVKSKSETSESPGNQESSTNTPFHRQLSNSMQDLRNCSSKQTDQLLKSQSDPDLSGDAPTLVSRNAQSTFLKGIPKARNITEFQVAGHSISSGSDATLVHAGTEEDLAIDAKEDPVTALDAVQSKNQKVSDSVGESFGQQSLAFAQASTSEQGEVSIHDVLEDQAFKHTIPDSEPMKSDAATSMSKQMEISSNTHVCSDTDHKRGLHHHFGVLCATVLGGHIQSPAQPNIGSQLENVVQGPDRIYSNAPNIDQRKQQSREAALSPAPQDSEILTGESTGSSAFHSDAAHEESVPCASTLTGRANSFEYLPGHIYEKNPKLGSRKHERPPGISTSTETDSEPVRPLSRVLRRKMIDSSSHDTEDDRLWASPRIGSNTLVDDLERGVNLLKEVMENKSAGRRCKRELVRRIIKKLVTSEYVEDIIEKEKLRHHIRSPFSPRKPKYHERQDRNIRSKRNLGAERQEISGESDEPKQRVHNVRRKLTIHQLAHHAPPPQTLTTLASGSKSSSLWSSHADNTTGSISLSGSSDNQKQSKISVKPNPLCEQHPEKSADWLKPATQSEKLFEMKKNGASHAEKHLAGLVGIHTQEPLIDPIAFKNDPQKQLSWVTNEINHLRILKQLLQKQESLKQSLDPNLCQTNFITMPVTGLKQTMQMADCNSPDTPEAHSPKLKPSRMQQWISLESDTSAGFGLSNHTGSSRDSHWQGVEVASAGDQDSDLHRTVSISDGDQMTDASCSLSNKKADVSQNSGSKNTQKTRRRSVSISDTDQLLGPPIGSDVPFQKKRSDCHCGKADSRVYSSRPPQAATYGPPPRNFSSDKFPKQVCESCSSHTHLARRDPVAPIGAVKISMANRGFSSLGPSRTEAGEPLLDDRSRKTQNCSCGGGKAKSCCCSPRSNLPPQNTGAVRKGSSASSHQIVSCAVTDLPPTSNQALSGGGLVRVHIEADHDLDSVREKCESQKRLLDKDRIRMADVPESERASIMRPASDDSITKAVREAVSSKVKSLRNLGHIEEAEVKIRVKVAPGQVSDDVLSQSARGRVLKSQDLEDDNSFYPSKHSDIDELISRQRAIDMETRQKLLSIAESRQRAQMGLHDVDRRIQDLLLQDYLSRQFKTPETTSTPHARLNVRVEAPVMQGSSIGVQSEVDKKTIGTSTVGAHLERGPPQRDESYVVSTPQVQQQPPATASSRGTCVCGPSPRQPQSLVNQGQQTEALARPQTAPVSCLCSCQSQPASSPRTYHASPPFASPERQVEFELELRKPRQPRPYNLTPYEVHETLKSRNTAYFLQFEEDPGLDLQPVREDPKPPMEVVTVKVPAQKQPGIQPSSSKHPVMSRGSKIINKSKPLSKVKTHQCVPSGSQGSTEGPSQSDKDSNFANNAHVSGPGVTSPSNAANILRITPGRSHLSITVTDSSAESVPSLDGDSRHSSYQHPSRKTHKSPRSKKRKEKIKTDDVSLTMESKIERSDSLSSIPSAMDQHVASSKRPANDNDSVFDYMGDSRNAVPTLQEYLEKNHPKYLDAAEKRRRCIAEMSYLRRLRQQSRKRLLELDGDNMWAKQKQQWRSRCASRPRPRTPLKKRPAPKSTRSACARRYMLFPETQQRLMELKKKEEKRTNRLMAEIYTRKLQEKVLKGTATIRSSVSVISSL